ncbi:MAG: C-GCAxxG-C-C family protein, partial [Oscillospiraceae bacterium]
GMTMVLSVALGYADPADREGKKRLYALTQKAGDAFRAKNGFLRCRDLLGIDAKAPLDPTPSERTADYYRRRPCDEIVKSAAEILEQILIDENILK